MKEKFNAVLDDIKNNPEQYELGDFPLKPCPFCGEKAKLICDDYPHMSYYVECQGCEACSREYDELDSPESAKIFAIDSWNRRVKK